MLLILIVFVGLLLAYANGANDNFKGVATLFGSGTTNYRAALGWATLTTALGSVAAMLFARTLLEAFRGKGLVPAEVVADPAFAAAVATAAGLTVLLATRLGFPVSTTHALIGALIGAGLLASPLGIDSAKLVRSFVVPLVLSPFLAVGGAMLIYPSLRWLRRRLGIEAETCLCVGEELVSVLPGRLSLNQALEMTAVELTVTTGDRTSCHTRYRGRLFGFEARPILDRLHFLSAGAVSFARGLNDTPKIAALLLVGGALSAGPALLLVGLMIAVGGLISARRVAETMSHRVTQMNVGQGFSSNLVSSLLVIGASRLGLPVSTTHVSCGSLFGIGAVNRQANWRVIGTILGSWLLTLPIAAVLAALIFLLLR